MEYRTFTIGEMMTNCYLFWSGSEAGVIDPGGPVIEVINHLKENELTLKWIVNTHGHADHISGNRTLKLEFDAPLLIHQADRGMLLSPTANLSAFLGSEVTSPDADWLLQEGDVVRLGKDELKVIETPGHTPGGISLYYPGLLFPGDTLFRESIGRTDLPGGNYRQLLRSIRERLLILPGETVVLPGHGEPTTIERELRWNPFLAEPGLNEISN